MERLGETVCVPWSTLCGGRGSVFERWDHISAALLGQPSLTTSGEQQSNLLLCRLSA